MLADFDAQPGRKAPAQSEPSPPNGKQTRPNCMPGSAECPGLWPAPKE